MYLQKVISRKNCVKKLVFCWHLEDLWWNRRIRIQDPEPDPSVRGMDPRIRIRIHPKMSWICNTGTRSNWLRMMPTMYQLNTSARATRLGKKNLFGSGTCGYRGSESVILLLRIMDTVANLRPVPHHPLLNGDSPVRFPCIRNRTKLTMRKDADKVLFSGLV
jgi:hypothetical protein